ncbi:MAG TPA: VOC family protein [Trueperaceae bacterium]
MHHPIHANIDGIFVTVRDLRKAAIWYGELLGIPVEHENPEGSRHSFRLNGGTLWLTLREGGPESTPAPSSGVLFNLTATDLQQAHAFVRAQGAPVVRDIETLHPGLSFFEFEDPDGNRLMIVSRDA